MRNVILGLVAVSVFVLFSARLHAEINESKAQKVGVPFDTCKPEEGVSYRAGDGDKLSTGEMEKLLIGNTLLSVDRYGTFAIFYPEKGKAVGWMPKEKSDGYSWSAGDVSFENDKYCRTWKEWRSGKDINCWEASQGDNHIDLAGFYFTCQNGKPDGDVHVVIPGNAFGISFSGSGAKSGKLTQDDAKAEQYYQKYFGNYVNK